MASVLGRMGLASRESRKVCAWCERVVEEEREASVWTGPFKGAVGLLEKTARAGGGWWGYFLFKFLYIFSEMSWAENSALSTHTQREERRGSHYSLVQSLSRVRLFVTPWIATHRASLSFTISGSLVKLMSIESVMPSNHLILCHPLLLSPSIFPSIRVFSSEAALRIRWPKDGSFSFNISPSNEHPGLISFRMDWLDLLARSFLTRTLISSWGPRPHDLNYP